MRRILAAIAMVLATACSSSPSTPSSSSLTLTEASVDPSYQCPGGANNAPYDLHATVGVHNGTSHTVTVNSVTAEMKLAAVKSDWLEKVGDRYDAGSVKFEPNTVAAHATVGLKVVIPSACTSGAYGSSPAHWGRYQVTVHLHTSSGAYSITAANLHEILTA